MCTLCSRCELSFGTRMWCDGVCPFGWEQTSKPGALTNVKCYLRDCNTNLGKWKTYTKGDCSCFEMEFWWQSWMICSSRNCPVYLRKAFSTLLWPMHLYKRFLFLIMCMCVFMCMCTWVQCVCRPEEKVRSLGARVTGSCEQMWMLGTKSGCSARAVNTHNLWAISPAPDNTFPMCSHLKLKCETIVLPRI